MNIGLSTSVIQEIRSNRLLLKHIYGCLIKRIWEVVIEASWLQMTIVSSSIICAKQVGLDLWAI
jgi:hypothetical protein